MRDVNAQALYTLSYLAPTDGGNYAVDQNGNRNIGFYTLGLEADIDINANISHLQLGCGGVNGADGCDIDIQNFSLGCIANSTGTCITLHPTGNQKVGAVPDGNPVDTSQQDQMKNLTLKNPFVEFAIKNPQSAALREVVGLRLGARGVEGPMSFGTLNSFSGYLTGIADLYARGEGKRLSNDGLAGDPNSTAINHDPNGYGVAASSLASSLYASSALGGLGLADSKIEILGGLVTTRYSKVTVSYTGQHRTGLDVSVDGVRQTQADVLGLNLGDVAYEIVESLDLLQAKACIGLSPSCTGDSGIDISQWDNNSTLSGAKQALLDSIKPNIANYVMRQLAIGSGSGGLGYTGSDTSTATLRAWLNNYTLPYNLSNVHQLQVNSNSFNIALSAFALQYPGYVTTVNQGWSLYMPDAFKLVIDDKLSDLVPNIASSSATRLGNITGLEAPYRNCWGNLTYC